MSETAPLTVAFDLDGTLVHTSPDIHAALQATLAHYGRAVTLRQTEEMIGDGLRALFAKALTAVKLELAADEAERACADFVAAYRASPCGLSTPHDWVVACADQFRSRGARVAVCTNKAEDIALHILELMGLATLFHSVVGHVDGRPKKPNAEPLLMAIEQARGDPRRAVLIGDSHSDVGAARAAGVFVVLVPHGYGPHQAATLDADRLVATSTELVSAVAELCPWPERLPG